MARRAGVPLADYQPGTTVLHLLPVGAKLLALVALSVVAVALRGVPTTSGLLTLAFVGCLVARVRLGRAARSLRGVMIGLALLAAYQTWQRGGEHAFVVVGALVASAAGEGLASWLGLAAVVLASINIFGGFAVTARMLAMYRKKER